MNEQITDERIRQLTGRVTELKIKIQIKEQKMQEALKEVSQMLQQLDEQTIDSLTAICPDAAMLKNLTVEDLSNPNSDIPSRLYAIIDSLYSYLDKRLTEFEEMV